ncbi:hypothetical protein [Thalassospira xiamenensis]|uniref:hypothetical protein n=1 Tax=Thalassospira xiamenensis TaxID=220697 RepID=UPI003AA91D29
MSKASYPFMQFYPSDWRADPSLRVCSIAARGLWLEMLCVMHEADPRGYLTIKGQPVTDAQLSALTAVPTDEITKLIGELETAGVFSRDGNRRIYSRRILRDEKKSKTARKNGKKGGNPKLATNRKQKEISPSDNLQDNTPLKGQDKPQIPDTRYQTPEDKSSLHSDLSPPTPQTGGEDENWIWNEGRFWFISQGLTETQIPYHLTEWLKAYPADQVRDAIATAGVSAPSDPVRFVAGRLRNGKRSNLQTFPIDRHKAKKDAERQEIERLRADRQALRSNQKEAGNVD